MVLPGSFVCLVGGCRVSQLRSRRDVLGPVRAHRAERWPQRRLSSVEARAVPAMDRDRAGSGRRGGSRRGRDRHAAALAISGRIPKGDSMTSPAIRTVGLSKQFSTVRALDDLMLEIPRGIIFAFLGPNGSGKTTTIRLLLGLVGPTSGNAQVLGYDIRTNAAAIRERTGALLKHCGLYE